VKSARRLKECIRGKHPRKKSSPAGLRRTKKTIKRNRAFGEKTRFWEKDSCKKPWLAKAEAGLGVGRGSEKIRKSRKIVK